MTRWLPYPLMSAFLLALWLLLNQSVSPGHVILGAVLAVAGSWALTLVEPPAGRPRRVRAIVLLASRVLVDIFRSNINVARIILDPPARSEIYSGFVRIHLDLRSPYGLMTLATIVTATPGTVWADWDSTDGMLLLHVLDLVDENTWVEIVKHRYEGLLLEIFE